MAAANRDEQRAVTMGSSEKGVRARLQEQHPGATPQEIEARVAKVMEQGRKPTKTEVLAKGSIPAEVLAERKATRRGKSKAYRNARRQDEIRREIERGNGDSLTPTERS
jgi:hypothetical protein